MDPLETLLRPLVALINRQIRATTPAREICRNIEGSVIAIRVANSALAAYFHVHSDSLALTGRYEDEPDVVISGSLLALGKLATPAAADAIGDGSVELRGDARVAQAFQRLLRYGRPDLEEELSNIIGDQAAHNVGEFARRFRKWSGDAQETMRSNVSEYLQEESRTVPSRYEADSFRDDVNTLRDDVARFEAKLTLLENQHARDGGD